MQCPSNSFRYNDTQCECNPGYLFNFTSRSCYLFNEWGPVESDSGVDYRSLSFPGSGTLFDFDSIRRLTQSQAVFLEATLIMLLSWLCFCFFARCAPLGDGRSIWFKIRWWISRLDICFASRHWLCEYRIKKLRNEDSVMRKVRSRRKAQDRWDKLRKYVMYKYAPNQLEEVYDMRNDGCCTGVKMESLHRKSSSVRGKGGSSRLDTISFSRKVGLPSEKRAIPEKIDNQSATRFSPEPAVDLQKHKHLKEERFQERAVPPNTGSSKLEDVIGPDLENALQATAFPAADDLTVPPPPPLKLQAADHISMTNLQKDLRNLYEYNMILREKLIAAQSMLHALVNKELTLAADSGDIITRE